MSNLTVRKERIDLDEARKLAASLSGRKLAKHFDIPSGTMQRWCREWGIVPMGGMKLRDMDAVAAMYDSGLTTIEIAEQTGSTHSNVARRLREHGVKMRPRGQNLGKKMPKSAGIKISAFRRGNFMGEANPNWRGGKRNYEKYKDRYSHQHKEWSKAVRERDSHTCQHCGTTKGRLHAHHIKSWIHHEESRFDVSNGLTLCPPCHQNVHGFAFPWTNGERGTSAKQA